MPGYYIWTIGCQMNKAESDRISGHLERQGYEKTSIAEQADIIILNSCVVRESAENRVIGRLNALREIKRLFPHITVALTGCLVGPNIDTLRKQFPFVDYFFKPGQYPPWIDKHIIDFVLPRNHTPVSYIPIIQGCNNFCSYCIVPYRRGREKSRPVTEIVNEVETLVRNGIKEVVLLGQNVNSYGRDLPEKPELGDLLALLNDIQGLSRIRFLTNHPKDMSPYLIEKIACLDKVCEEISLPVQSGSNIILQAMGRGYTVEQYRRLIAAIRNRIPGVAVATDIIVGFPSESDGHFEETCNLISEIRFDVVHVAAYSTRPGTIASRTMIDNIPTSVKRERLQKIEAIQKTIAGENNHNLIGSKIEVLVEGKKKGRWWGRARSGKLIFFIAGDGDLTGNIMNIDIKRAGPWALQGDTTNIHEFENREAIWTPI